ncbi:pilin [Catellatospora paridis]|uniref:pilin n=1 Tax=Catellatospora paridis TaxID=1617086 RepID=UPI0012D3AAE7|nr:pilin [Catellatospora paridis]
MSTAYQLTEHLAASTDVLAAVKPLPDIIDAIQTWVMNLIFAVASVFATIGAAYYTMAGGDPAKIEKSKEHFKSALKGYALALLTPIIFGILNSILGVGADDSDGGSTDRPSNGMSAVVALQTHTPASGAAAVMPGPIGR